MHFALALVRVVEALRALVLVYDPLVGLSQNAFREDKYETSYL